MKETNTHIYFWGTEFSNFYICKFNYEGHEFNNSEQAFMWEKARTFQDDNTADLILQTPKPRESKELGKIVKNFQESVWNNVCYEIMKKVNLAKWSQNPNLETKLLSTGNKILVEGSPEDTIWGVGLKYDDPLILNEKNWKGKNYLGRVLMDIREYLKNPSQK